MKKIIYLYHTSAVGGGSYCLLNILKSIDRTTYQPFVLLMEEGPLVKEIKKLDIEVLFLKKMRTVPYNSSTFTLKKIRNAVSIVSSFKAYKRILEKVHPDIVYVNTMMLYPYLRPAKACGANTIIHIREHWPENEHVWQRNTALDHIDKYADHIVGINSYSISMLDFSKKPKTTVYDWIDLRNRYKEMPFSAIFNEDMSNKKVYLFMGGMQPIKGTYEIFKTFHNIITDKNARLLAIGFTKSNYNNGWKGKAKKIMSYLGKTPYTEKVRKILESDCRIKCIPSEYKINNLVQQAYCILSYFTIPHANLALAESIILGTPTIAADTEESREYSLSGKLACLFKINDISDFQNKIIEFDRERPMLLAEIKRNSNKVQEMFDPINNSLRLNDIYKLL